MSKELVTCILSIPFLYSDLLACICVQLEFNSKSSISRMLVFMDRLLLAHSHRIILPGKLSQAMLFSLFYWIMLPGFFVKRMYIYLFICLFIFCFLLFYVVYASAGCITVVFLIEKGGKAHIEPLSMVDIIMYFVQGLWAINIRHLPESNRILPSWQPLCSSFCWHVIACRSTATKSPASQHM
jgi:hypothetical protein